MADLFNLEEDRRCIYKEELYSVRNNGMVLRHSKIGGRMRKYDNQWTYGNENFKNGYLEIASATVHRIIATAYHGDAPTKEHVVDHIDTNRHNNRPENLRWVTRLENVLLNPITSRRIASICGSVEAFLADPAKFRNLFPDPRFDWMCAVSKEEAEMSRERLLAWAKSDKPWQGGSLGDWIFSRGHEENILPTPPRYIISKTPNAVQGIVFSYEDKPNEYPSTPQAFDGNPLVAYYEKLTSGSVFFRNHNGEYVVVKRGFSRDRQSLYVLTKAAYTYQEVQGDRIPVPLAELSEQVNEKNLPHSLAIVTYEDGLFMHDRAETGFHPTEELEEMFASSIQ
ncbi:HNH endonuclease signature motif containing protein [Pedobacter cryotolerans]|uniref:HNH endonuclease n=1 Tax=Pedobacter cryotolerans TaxID=2571270 RepID=A0A4U1BWH9_9SPHI|nr:HNH endonuclease signature motif containing protein [Pedobacter cryotolerans]TKB97299.1 HNH endonuclease [Pedobacter cryotolerans]